MYEKFCNKCGTTLSEFYQTGMLGCPFCYSVFANELLPVIKEIQGTTAHVGKAPKIAGVDKQLLAEYSRLKLEKEQAGLEGRFSDMARLTQEIFELKQELERRGLI